jgi:hypothetical protein
MTTVATTAAVTPMRATPTLATRAHARMTVTTAAVIGTTTE